MTTEILPFRETGCKKIRNSREKRGFEVFGAATTVARHLNRLLYYLGQFATKRIEENHE